MNCYFAMDNVIEGEGHYYFVSLYNNGIYEIYDDLYVKKISQIPFEYQEGYMEYSKIYYFERKFFILPWYSQKLVIYDLDKNEYRYMLLNEDNQGLRYLKAFPYNEFLYLIPCENKEILKINMISEEIEKCIEISVSKENHNKIIAWGEIAYDNNAIIIPQVYDNRLLKFNYINDKVDYLLSSLEKLNGLCGICDTDGGRWYIPRRTNKIYFESTKEIYEYCNFPADYLAGDISFYKIIPDRNRIFLLPRDSNMLLIATEKGELFNLMTINPNKEDVMERYMYFSNAWKMDNKWFCIESRSGQLYEITKENKLKKCHFIEKKDSRAQINDMLTYENCYHEKMLTDFISYIINDGGKK